VGYETYIPSDRLKPFIRSFAIQEVAEEFRNLPGTGTILVFFKEAGAAPFFRQPLRKK